jgi:hypothetical protein
MDCLDGGEDVAFAATQGRKAKERKLRLDLADVVAAEGKIMGKISSAATMGLVKGQRVLEKRRL